MANFLGQRTRVEFNGHDVSHLTGASIGGMGITMDTFQTLNDPFDHDIEIEDEATGSFDFVASDVAGADNKFKEIFNLVLGYQDLADSDGGALVNGDTGDSHLPTDINFDATEEVNYTVPRFLTVYRRISELGATKIELDAVEETCWIKFRAQGERIDTLFLAIKTETANQTFTVSIVTDSSGVPTDSLVSSVSATGTQTAANSTFSSANKWFSVGLPASWNDADRLTVGTDYWLKIIKQNASGSLFIPLADSNQDYGGFYFDSDHTIAGAASTYDGLKEAGHYIKFKQTEGLKVEVFDFIDAAETSGVKYTFNKVKLDSVTPSFANKQATRASVSWKCNDWSYDVI